MTLARSIGIAAALNQGGGRPLQSDAANFDWWSVQPTQIGAHNVAYFKAATRTDGSPPIRVAQYITGVHFAGPMDVLGSTWLPLSLPEDWYAHSVAPSAPNWGPKTRITSGSGNYLMEPYSSSVVTKGGFTYHGWIDYRRTRSQAILADGNGWDGLFIDVIGLYGVAGAIDPTTGKQYTDARWLAGTAAVGAAMYSAISGDEFGAGPIVCENALSGASTYFGRNSGAALTRPPFSAMAESFLGTYPTLPAGANSYLANVQMIAEVTGSGTMTVGGKTLHGRASNLVLLEKLQSPVASGTTLDQWSRIGCALVALGQANAPDPAVPSVYLGIQEAQFDTTVYPLPHLLVMGSPSGAADLGVAVAGLYTRSYAGGELALNTTGTAISYTLPGAGTLAYHEAATPEVTKHGGDVVSVAPNNAVFYLHAATVAPTVTGLDVTTGGTAGGTPVQITGTGFAASGGATVAFGANPATSVNVVSDTEITCVSPAGSAGTVDVTVTTGNGISATSSADHFVYSASSVPVITGVSPNTGSISGGTLITVTGRNLSSITSVAFGAVSVGIIPVSSDTTQSLRTPAHAVGIYHITATNGSGTSTPGPADLFTFTQANSPSVTGVSPGTGVISGGTPITVTGTNFVAGSTTVAVGGVAATGVTVASPTSLQCTTPAAGGAGTVNVVVTTGNGSSPTTPACQFTYASPRPVVTGVVPSSGPTAGGSAAKITGSGLTAATVVDFGANPATGVTVVSDSEVDCVTPAGAAGAVDVTVTTPGGTSATGSADQFTYNTTGLSAITLTAPRSIQAGDLMQVFAAWAGTSITMTTPTGYTATTMVTGTGFRMQHFWKIATTADATASAAGTLTVVLTASAPTEIVASLRSDYNEDQTNPFDPAPSVSGQANVSSTTIAASAGITTGHPNGRAVVFLVTTAAAGGTPPGITLPANFVARGSQRSSSNAAGLNLSVLTGDLDLGTAGATGAIAGTAASACVNGGMAVVVKASQ